MTQKEKAIKFFQQEFVKNVLDNSMEIAQFYDIAIKTLYQEPKTETEVFDKIRAEIERMDYLSIEDGSDGYDEYVDRYDVLQIIDKYRESEVRNVR